MDNLDNWSEREEIETTFSEKDFKLLKLNLENTTGLEMLLELIPVVFIILCLKASRASSGASYTAHSSVLLGTWSNGVLRLGFSFTTWRKIPVNCKMTDKNIMEMLLNYYKRTARSIISQ